MAVVHICIVSVKMCKQTGCSGKKRTLVQLNSFESPIDLIKTTSWENYFSASYQGSNVIVCENVSVFVAIRAACNCAQHSDNGRGNGPKAIASIGGSGSWVASTLAPVQATVISKELRKPAEKENWLSSAASEGEGKRKAIERKCMSTWGHKTTELLCGPRGRVLRSMDPIEQHWACERSW